jgi:hypothetical protein
MAQLPPQTNQGNQGNKQQPQQAQIIQVSGALGQNATLGQMVIAQPANAQPTPVVTATPKGKGRVIKSEVSFSLNENHCIIS